MNENGSRITRIHANEITLFWNTFDFQKKSGLKASDGHPCGDYPFFTSIGLQKKFTATPFYNVESLVFGTGGSASIHHVTGNFSATNDCLVATTRNPNTTNARYVYHYLSANLHLLENGFKGAGLKHISKSYIEDIKIPLPPLEEQKRIATMLDKAEELRRKRRESIAALDSLTQSIFLDLFDSPESKKWSMTSVEHLIADGKGNIRTGPFGSQLLHSEFVDEGIAVLGIDNAVQNRFCWAKPRFITEVKYEQLARYTVRPRDVIITIMGTCGRCAIVPENVPLAINTKHLCCITLNQKKCLPEFLHAYFLMHPTAQRYLAQKAKGAIMDGLNMGTIKELPVPETPMKLQQQFKTVSEKIETQRTKLLAAQTETENLFTALQQKAFSHEN